MVLIVLKLQIIDNQPCGNSFPYDRTECGMIDSKSGKSIIVPEFDIFKGKGCTAILDWNTKTWTKAKMDQRTSTFGGRLVT